MLDVPPTTQNSSALLFRHTVVTDEPVTRTGVHGHGMRMAARRIQRLATGQRRGIFSVKQVSDRLLYASARDGDGIDNIVGVGRRFAVGIAFDFRGDESKAFIPAWSLEPLRRPSSLSGECDWWGGRQMCHFHHQHLEVDIAARDVRGIPELFESSDE